MTAPQTPPFATLVSWVEGRLDTAKSAEIERVVAASPEARASVEWIREFIEAADDMPLISPPSSASDKIRTLFRRRFAPWSPSDHLDAQLVFDSRDYPAASGMRAGEADDTTHLIFESGPTRLELNLVRGPLDQLDVHGFATWAGLAEDGRLDIVLTGGRAVRHITRCAPGGVFHIEQVDHDVDELWITQGPMSVRAAIPSDVFGNT